MKIPLVAVVVEPIRGFVRFLLEQIAVVIKTIMGLVRFILEQDAVVDPIRFVRLVNYQRLTLLQILFFCQRHCCYLDFMLSALLLLVN